MLNKQSLYIQVADSLAADIYSGEYRQQEKLPSIAALAEEYEVGQNTIRAALKILAGKGLIEAERGSGVYVLYDRSVLARGENYGLWLAQRREVVLDIGHLHELFMPPLLSAAVRHLSDSDLTALQAISQRAEGAELPMRQVLGEMGVYVKTMLAALKNSTLIYLYDEVTKPIRLTLLLGPEQPLHWRFFRDQAQFFLSQSTSLLTQGRLRQAERFFYNNYQTMRQLLTRYVEDTAAPAGPPSLPFRFALQAEDRFRYARLANVIAADILGGEFSDSGLLPTAQELCAKYQVSLVTMRRALQMLSRHGMVETVNGVGTRVILGRSYTEYRESLPAIRPEDARLALECMQTVALVTGVDLEHTLENTDDEALRRIADKTLSRIADVNQTGGWAIGISMNMLMERCDCQAVQVIYPQLMFRIMLTNRRTWLHSPEYREVFQGMRKQIAAAMSAMQQRDAEGCGALLRAVTCTSLNLAQRFFASQGITTDMPLP